MYRKGYDYDRLIERYGSVVYKKEYDYDRLRKRYG